MNKLIEIQKIDINPEGLPAAKDRGEYLKENGDKSLPVNYTIEGYLNSDIQVGSNVVVARTKRDGVECLGMFCSSTVLEVSENCFVTRNSVYRYKYL